MGLIAKNLVPLNGQILVQDKDRPEKISGIYLPENADGEKMLEGLVLGVSDVLLEDGSYSTPLVKNGMRVVYNNFAGAGNQWKEDKTTYRLIKFNEILAVVCK